MRKIKIKMKNSYIIPQKPSNTGTIYDLASEHFDRQIVFAKNSIYAVVCAAYYGGKGYTTHASAKAAIKASKALGDYNHSIIDVNGEHYDIFHDRLVPVDQ